MADIELANDAEMANGNRADETVAASATALMVAGASFDDIARMLEFKSARHAKRVVERALSSTVTLDEKKAMRILAARRYESLLKSVMPRATNVKESNQLAYNQRAQSLVDRIVKLHGLEAPQQIQISPSDEYLASYAQQLAQNLGIDTNSEEEADILEEPEMDSDCEPKDG